MAILIFDYDGTLHDCIKIYLPAFQLAYDHLVSCELMQKKTWKKIDIIQWLGYSAKDMWDNFAPHISKEKKEFCSKIIGEEMLYLTNNGQAQLYKESYEILDKLKKDGHKMIFLSNCKRRYMKLHCEKFMLDQYFSELYCAEDFAWIPKYEIFKKIKSDFLQNYVVIGDRIHDIEIAQYHGLKSIGCGYGYGNLDELKKADIIVKNPLEIKYALDFLLMETEKN